MLTIANKKNLKNRLTQHQPHVIIEVVKGNLFNKMKTQIQKNGSKWIIGLIGTREEVEQNFSSYYLHGATNNANIEADGEDAEGKSLLRFYSTEAKFFKSLVLRNQWRIRNKMEQAQEHLPKHLGHLGLGVAIVHGAKRAAEEDMQKVEFVTDLFKYDGKNDSYSLGDISAERPDSDGTDSDSFTDHDTDFNL